MSWGDHGFEVGLGQSVDEADQQGVALELVEAAFGIEDHGSGPATAHIVTKIPVLHLADLVVEVADEILEGLGGVQPGRRSPDQRGRLT